MYLSFTSLYILFISFETSFDVAFSILTIKFASLKIIKEITGEYPVLLLDDVLSELDSDRQNHLLKSLDEIQTVITCTGLDEFIENRFSINKVFQVTKGKIEERTV